MAKNNNSIFSQGTIRKPGDTVTRHSDIGRSAGLTGARINEAIKNLYSVVIYDMVSNTAYNPELPLDPSGKRKSAEFFFSVPPKVHEFTEPFATTIVPTQDGGRYVESHGSIMKEIRVSGTTGFRPNKTLQQNEIPLLGQGPVNQAVAIEDALTSPLFGTQATRITEILNKEVTGYDDVMFLRNIFRLYSDIKDKEVQRVWVNR